MGFFSKNIANCDFCAIGIKSGEDVFQLIDGVICENCQIVSDLTPDILMNCTLEDATLIIAEQLNEILNSVDVEGETINPRTAQEMYAFSELNGYNLENEKKALKHFSVIEGILLPDEKVLTAFMTLTEGNEGLNALTVSQAVAVTDRRIIVGCSRPLGDISETIDLGNINNITLEMGLALNAKITIKTLVGETVFPSTKVQAPSIHSELNQILYEYKSNSAQANIPQVVQAPSVPTAADEIRQFKELLDDGIITQEEFDAKKKELLGL